MLPSHSWILAEAINTKILTKNYPDSLHSHSDSPNSHPDTLHSHPDSPHSVLWFPISAFADSPWFYHPRISKTKVCPDLFNTV